MGKTIHTQPEKTKSEENKHSEAETTRTEEIDSKKLYYSEIIEEGSQEQQPVDKYQPDTSESLPSAKKCSMHT